MIWIVIIIRSAPVDNKKFMIVFQHQQRMVPYIAMVVHALAARGANPDAISLAGRGEAEPAVATEDGVPEPANRRVEIIVLP